jgi:hypothetical protein
MTIDFKARTRAQLQGIDDSPKPGESLPHADEESLREMGATENWPRITEYQHPSHNLTDFSRPGYFTGDLRARMHVGDQIYYCLYAGSKDPCDWQRGIAVVIEVPSSREEPLILAGILEYPQPQPWTGEKKDKAA